MLLETFAVGVDPTELLSETWWSAQCEAKLNQRLQHFDGIVPGLDLSEVPAWDECDDTALASLAGKCKDVNLLDSQSESFFEGNPEDFMAYLDQPEAEATDSVKYET